jgi:superfamily II DNA or RNA helicase
MGVNLNTVVWRPYQEECKKKIKENYDKGITRQLVVQATGTGKRMQAVDLMRHFKRSLFIAHREELIMQAYNEIDNFWPMHAGIIKGRLFEIDKRIVVASVQTLTNRLDKMDPAMFDFVAIDEGHHYMSPTYLRVARHFTPKLTTVWTATPKRLDGLSLSNIVDKIVFEYYIRDGIADGYLAPIEAYQIRTQSDLSHVKRTAGDFNQQQLSEEVDTELRNTLAAAKYKQYASGKQAIAFCVDMDHAYHVRDKFREEGISAETIVSDINRCPNRAELFAGFANKEYEVLTNVNIATEGYDYNDIGCILMLRPTQSETLYTQCIGRGTRLKSIEFINRVGNDKCIVLDFVDNTGKLALVNAYELEKSMEIEQRIFLPEAYKLKLIEERDKKKRMHVFTYGQDSGVDILSLPKISVWESAKMLEPATDKQIKWLKDVGIWVPGVEYTKKQASESISGLPCQSWQLIWLANMKYDVSKGATFGQYQRIKAMLSQKDKFRIPNDQVNKALRNMNS